MLLRRLVAMAQAAPAAAAAGAPHRITEGRATITSMNQVFYNHAMTPNRDLSVAIVRAYVEMRVEEHRAKHGDAAILPTLKILDALSASGARSCHPSFLTWAPGLHGANVHLLLALLCLPLSPPRLAWLGRRAPGAPLLVGGARRDRRGQRLGQVERRGHPR